MALTKAVDIAQSYQPSRVFQSDVYDCNDIAEELWSVYCGAGTVSYLVVGNLKTKNEDFLESDHCWVVVFCVDEPGEKEVTLAVDPQVSLVGVVEGADGVAADQYIEGFFYADPDSLGSDLKARW